jgi:hypothetical protein
MPARRTLALLLACLIPLVASCGGDSKDDSAGGTTTSASAPQTITGDTSATTQTTQTTQPQLGVAEGVAKLNQSIDAAKGDRCALAKIVQTLNIAVPTNADQTKQAVAAVVRYFNVLADAAPDQAAVLRKAASGLEAEAKAAGYDPSALAESKALTSDDFGTAMATISSKCSTAG